MMTEFDILAEAGTVFDKEIEALQKRVKTLEEASVDKQIDNLIMAFKSAQSKELSPRETAKYRALATKVTELYSLAKGYAERK